MSFLKRLFSRKEEPAEPYDEQAEQAWDKAKSEFMESVLGKEHDMVMHAIIPYAVGGGLDLYYYPNGIAGTGIATKELVDSKGKGPRNRAFKCYELVMFTRHAINLEQAQDMETPFGRAHANMNSIINRIAPYSAQATLNPNETCEFPQEMEKVGGKYLMFDAYPTPDTKGPKDMGLMLVLEVFRSEMDFARQHGGAELFQKLKEAGAYPHSDLDREPVA